MRSHVHMHAAGAAAAACAGACEGIALASGAVPGCSWSSLQFPHMSSPGTRPAQVLNVCYNSLRAVPLARDDCRALQRLCCDLSALAGSGHLLGEMPALEEVDVLWCHRKAQSPPLRPSAEECKRARGQQAAALAALRSAHRLRVVGLEDSLASALGGGSGSWDGEAYWAAGAAAREAWERDLPGKKVVQVHTHLGPGRRMPDYGQLAWDEV